METTTKKVIIEVWGRREILQLNALHDREVTSRRHFLWVPEDNVH